MIKASSDLRMKIMRDDDLDPVNVDLFNSFIEGFMQGVVAVLRYQSVDVADCQMIVTAGDREWKSYTVTVLDGDSHTLAYFYFDPRSMYDKLVVKYENMGYSREDSEDIVMITTNIGLDEVRERVSNKLGVKAATEAATHLGIEPPEEAVSDIFDNIGFKPDRGEA
jgi:hypothetical protein